MLEPSSGWTEVERLEVIRAKAEELTNALQADVHVRAISHRTLMLVANDLHLIAYAPAEALEMNRETLLAPVLLREVRSG